MDRFRRGCGSVRGAGWIGRSRRCLELALDPDRCVFARDLIDNVKRPELELLVGAGLGEVVGPDVIVTLRQQS